MEEFDLGSNLDPLISEVSDLILSEDDHSSSSRLKSVLQAIKIWVPEQTNKINFEAKVKNVKNDRIAQTLFEANVDDPGGKRCARYDVIFLPLGQGLAKI